MFLDSHQVREGWYPDPSGRLVLRYWDGSAWSEDTKGTDGWAMPADGTPAAAATTTHAPETGWAGVAFALHSALLNGNPATVIVTLPSRDTFTVDTLNQVYSWSNEPEVLPAFSGSAGFGFMPASGEPSSQSRSLDGLLWRVSGTAFPSRLAPWLQEDDLYRMQRWPNLTTINPHLDDMRQAAMLANGMFTVDELAGFSDRSVIETRTLINALSLMNTLKVATPRSTSVFVPAPGSFGVAQPQLVEQKVAAPPRALPQTRQKPGLFQRLRSRLGL